MVRRWWCRDIAEVVRLSPPRTKPPQMAPALQPGRHSAHLQRKINTGVTGKHYIERLRLAPDVSGVLQVLIQIADENGLRSGPRVRSISRSVGAPASPLLQG